MKAVVDRIEGNIAVVLFSDNEVKVNIPLELLPQGTYEGAWLNVYFELDSEGTEKQREKIQNLLDKLKNKNK